MLDDKEQSAIDLITKALKIAKNPIMAFSGGKDSTVTRYLIAKVKPSINSILCNTLIENVHTINYCHAIPNLIEVFPEKNFWQCVDQYGWPEGKSKAKSHGNRCCYWLKEKPAHLYYKENHVDLVFTGLTSTESRNRMMVLKRMGPLYQMKSGLKLWKCHPIHDWTEKDVWDYIHKNNIPYNTIYRQGAIRCGCMPCTAYLSWQERLARENPTLFKLVMKRKEGIIVEDQENSRGCD